MEIHKNLSQISNFQPDLNSPPEVYFQSAFDFVEKFYLKELNNYISLDFNKVSPDHFFSEYVWVVHATGFSAKAVGKMMPKLSSAYGSYDVLCKKTETELYESVLPVCNNPSKAKSIWSMAKIMQAEISTNSWEKFRDNKLSKPELLQKLPYIGKITCFHLARNIGILDSVKPDLHLVRMAKHWNFTDCNQMCIYLQEKHLEKSGKKLELGIIDLILWYSASTFGTISIKD